MADSKSARQHGVCHDIASQPDEALLLVHAEPLPARGESRVKAFGERNVEPSQGRQDLGDEEPVALGVPGIDGQVFVLPVIVLVEKENRAVRRSPFTMAAV